MMFGRAHTPRWPGPLQHSPDQLTTGTRRVLPMADETPSTTWHDVTGQIMPEYRCSGCESPLMVLRINPYTVAVGADEYGVCPRCGLLHRFAADLSFSRASSRDLIQFMLDARVTRVWRSVYGMTPQ